MSLEFNHATNAARLPVGPAMMNAEKKMSSTVARISGTISASDDGRVSLHYQGRDFEMNMLGISSVFDAVRWLLAKVGHDEVTEDEFLDNYDGEATPADYAYFKDYTGRFRTFLGPEAVDEAFSDDFEIWARLHCIQ